MGPHHHQVLEKFAGAATASLEARSREIQQTQGVVSELPQVVKEALRKAGVKETGAKTGRGDGGDGDGDDDGDDGGGEQSDAFDIWGATTAPTVLLTTSVAARGLDFSNLTHVYSLNVFGANAKAGVNLQESSSSSSKYSSPGGNHFMNEEAEYAHQAGRLGRLGNLCGASHGGGGKMTSIVGLGLEGHVRGLVAGVAEVGADVAEEVPPEVQGWSLEDPPFADEDEDDDDDEEATSAAAAAEGSPTGGAVAGSSTSNDSTSGSLNHGMSVSERRAFLEDAFELFDAQEEE